MLSFRDWEGGEGGGQKTPGICGPSDFSGDILIKIPTQGPPKWIKSYQGNSHLGLSNNTIILSSSCCFNFKSYVHYLQKISDVSFWTNFRQTFGHFTETLLKIRQIYAYKTWIRCGKCAIKIVFLTLKSILRVYRYNDEKRTQIVKSSSVNSLKVLSFLGTLPI